MVQFLGIPAPSPKVVGDHIGSCKPVQDFKFYLKSTILTHGNSIIKFLILKIHCNCTVRFVKEYGTVDAGGAVREDISGIQVRDSGCSRDGVRLNCKDNCLEGKNQQKVVRNV